MEDERIFSPTDMWDFAYEIAQKAIIAGLKGSKYIDGMSIEDYITQELENQPGS